MTSSSDHSVKCKDCGLPLPEGEKVPREPCPECGSTRRAISVSIHDTVNVSGRIAWETRREFYEKNILALVVVALIAIGSPVLGLFIAGLPGVLIGLLLSGVSYFLGPIAVTNVREIRSSS